MPAPTTQAAHNPFSPDNVVERLFRGATAAAASAEGGDGRAAGAQAPAPLLAAQQLWQFWQRPSVQGAAHTHVRVPPLHASLGAPRKRQRIDDDERGAFAKMAPVIRPVLPRDLDASLVRRQLEVRVGVPAAAAGAAAEWVRVLIVDVELDAKKATVALADGSRETLDLNEVVADEGRSIRIVVEAASSVERQAAVASLATATRYNLPSDEPEHRDARPVGDALNEVFVDAESSRPNVGWTRQRLSNYYELVSGGVKDVHQRRITKERMVAMIIRCLRGDADTDAAVTTVDIEEALAKGAVPPADMSAFENMKRIEATAVKSAPGKPKPKPPRPKKKHPVAMRPPPVRDSRFLVRNRDCVEGNLAGRAVEVRYAGEERSDAPAYHKGTVESAHTKRGDVKVLMTEGPDEGSVWTGFFKDERVAWPVGFDAEGENDKAVKDAAEEDE